MLLSLASLGPRLSAALDYGRDWYAPGSFTLINFDEAGSCRAALDGFAYSPLVGWQTLTLTKWSGLQIPPEIAGDARAVKSFCHSEAHLTIARIYSAALGAATVSVLVLLAWLLFPTQSGVGITAGALLALSGWHISESMMGTVDAASTFFIYATLTALVWAAGKGGWRWLIATLLLVPAVWTKYWVFALVSFAVVIPATVVEPVFRGLGRVRLSLLLLAYAALFAVITNPASASWLTIGATMLFYIVPPWRQLTLSGRMFLLGAPLLAPLAMQFDVFTAFTAGGMEGRFGTDYAAIGGHKWLRNALNIPLVLLLGIGVPAFLFLLVGVRRLYREASFDRRWLALLPLPAFALYMLFLAPVTYYRHYLPLLPAACLVSAYGLYTLGRAPRRAVLVLMLIWQAALAWDLVSDYHSDPRRALAAWYSEHRPARVLTSYYVNPPPGTGAMHRTFLPVDATRSQARLRWGEVLILSENWYDTAFANELNGPLVDRPQQLIKTRPEAVEFYRTALADNHPMLRKAAHFSASTFMPELWLHYRYYGSFTQFVGDIVVFEIKP
ncbi:MAG: ArnT family glycosyltransferase [Congregibacter sp.]